MAIQKLEIKGFTLTEMVIAIVVLGVIASIAVPKYLAVRNSAREAVKTSAINTVRTAITMLYARNRDYPTNAQIVSLLAIGEDTQHNKKLEAEAVNNGIKLQIGITGDNYVVETFTDAKCTAPTKESIDRVLCAKSATNSTAQTPVSTALQVYVPPNTGSSSITNSEIIPIASKNAKPTKAANNWFSDRFGTLGKFAAHVVGLIFIWTMYTGLWDRN